jgi:hypothetical protein
VLTTPHGIVPESLLPLLTGAPTLFVLDSRPLARKKRFDISSTARWAKKNWSDASLYNGLQGERL